MLLCIVKSIFFWGISLLIIQSIVRMIVQGLYWSPSRSNFIMTLFSFVMIIAFFYTVYHFWNIYFSLSAGLLLVSCLPDMIRIPETSLPKGPTHILVNIVTLLTVPLFWYVLCPH